MKKIVRMIDLSSTLDSLYQAREHFKEVLFNPNGIYDECTDETLALQEEYKKLNKIIDTIEDITYSYFEV